MIEIIKANRDENPFALVITDMQIPLFENDFRNMLDEGGREIIEEMEYRGIDIPYVVCSSAVEENDFPNAVKVIKYDYCTSYRSIFEQIIQTLRKRGND